MFFSWNTTAQIASCLFQKYFSHSWELEFKAAWAQRSTLLVGPLNLYFFQAHQEEFHFMGLRFPSPLPAPFIWLVSSAEWYLQRCSALAPTNGASRWRSLHRHRNRNQPGRRSSVKASHHAKCCRHPEAGCPLGRKERPWERDQKENTPLSPSILGMVLDIYRPATFSQGSQCFCSQAQNAK